MTAGEVELVSCPFFPEVVPFPFEWIRGWLHPQRMMEDYSSDNSTRYSVSLVEEELANIQLVVVLIRFSWW